MQCGGIWRDVAFPWGEMCHPCRGTTPHPIVLSPKGTSVEACTLISTSSGTITPAFELCDQGSADRNLKGYRRLHLETIKFLRF